jgi:hypothetical protein
VRAAHARPGIAIPPAAPVVHCSFSCSSRSRMVAVSRKNVRRLSS